jgi:hypothetical protein
MMMHEDWGAAQNYVVADAGEALICYPLTAREMRVGWQRFAVEKRISPLRCSR